MKHIPILFNIVVIVFLCMHASLFHASNAMNLSAGQVVCKSPQDRPYCVPEQEIFSDLVLSIAENGEVSGQAQRSISFEHGGARGGTTESYTGTARIDIRGTYDSTERTMKGTYDYKSNLTYIVHRGEGDDSDPLSRTTNYEKRVFTGKADGDSFRITFDGLGEAVYASGSLDDTSEDTSENPYAKEFEKNIGQKIIYEYGAGGGFSDMFGQVEVNVPQPDGSYDEEDWTFAKLDGMTLPPGTRIKTSGKSGAMLNFGPNTFFMGAESELEIVNDPAQPGQVELLFGNLKANVKKMMKDGSMEIEMSQAVAGIKGTVFVLSDDNDTSSLKVIEGVVSFKSKISGQAETITAGETIMADANGLGNKVRFDIDEENAKWQDSAEKKPSTESLQKNDSRWNYALWIPLLAAVIGGAWVVKKRKSDHTHL